MNAVSVTEVQRTGDDNNEPSFIVGIGASAGGLRPLERIVSHLAPHDNCCYVIIQHLSPDFESHLPQIIQRWTELPVRAIGHGVAIAGGTVYVAPAGARVWVHEGRFLINKEEQAGVPMPIDDFFRSIAHEAGRYAVGVVISGTGRDGTRGAEAIASSDGLVIAQSPETADFEGMPRSVISSGVCHLSMPPDSIGSAIDQFVTTPISAEQLSEQVFLPDAERLEPILELLSDRFSIEFQLYKQTTIRRRIDRRMNLRKLTTYDEYAEVLRNDEQERKQLFDDLLIGVTAFFRDPMVFDRMKEEHLRQQIEELPPGNEIRVWIAGCATGEEAYTLAMIIHEIFSELNRPPHAKIFATDLHHQAIQTASRGIYSADAVSGVSEQRLQRYFDEVPEGYRVRDELRQMLIFAPHNVVTDAPFLRLDLVCCRNLLIYLQPYAQNRVLSLFHFSLRQGGLLLLGTSETPGKLADDFEAIDSRWRIFRKRHAAGESSNHRFQTGMPGALASPSEKSRQKPTLHTQGPLLDQFMPPGILIDGSREVVHCYGGAERHLRIPAGEISRAINSLLIEPLRSPVSLALQRLQGRSVPARVHASRIHLDDRPVDLVVSAETIEQLASQNYVFIRIETVSAAEQPGSGDTSGGEKSADGNQSSHAPSPVDVVAEDAGVAADHVRMLEDELQSTRENLQATIEELEASNEELQATNQELTASNEELQSTNEELHSVNEELFTVNTDHQRKIGELIEVTEDLNNLLAGTDVGVMFLDGELRIRKFTERICSIFDLVEADIGRKITAFKTQLRTHAFIEDLQRVQESGEAWETEVKGPDGRHHLVRVLPYQTVADDSAGVPPLIITVVDITSVKLEELRRERLRELIDQSKDFIVSTDQNGIVETWNRGAEQMIGVSSAAAIGRPILDVMCDRIEGDCFEDVFKGEPYDVVEELVGWKLKENDQRDTLMVNYRIAVKRDDEGAIDAVSIIAHDISEIAAANRRVANSEHELRRVMESVTEAIIVLDPGWRYIFVNDGMCDMLGRSREEMLGRSIWEDLPEASDSPFGSNFREAMETGQTIRFEEYFDPTERWYQCYCFPSDERLTVFFTDVTESRLSTDLLRQQAEMLELSHDAIFAWELDGGITYWNRGAELLYGFSKSEVLGKKTHDVLKTEHPHSFESIARQLRDEGEWEGRLGHYNRQKERIEIASRKQLVRLNSNGQEIVLETNRDMTEYDRLSERVEQLASIADLTTDFVATANAAGEVLFVNRGAAEMLGYDSPDQIRGVNLSELHPPEIMEKLRREVFPRAAEGEVCHFESELLTQASDRLPISQVVMAHLDGKRTATHYSTIARDISQQKANELKLASMRDAAESANRAKSAFLAQMSHEIRTPMTAILGCSEQLLESATSEENVQLSRVMVEQGHALMAILDDILDLSRIEAEKIELEFRDINVVKVLCDLHRLMLSRAEDTGLRFELDLSGKFPLRFRTDAVRLRQVIVNLLSNAFKFTPQGQVTLASRCMHSDYGSELQIEVTDSGVGIDKEDLQRIFDAFSRLHHPHAKAAGTGLGLTIAHRLTERLGGELDVESTPNEGTTFTIRIPVQPPEQTEYIDHREAMDDSRTGPRSNGASAQKQLPLHVLVAEDTDAIRFLLSKILSPAVEKLTMVEDGAQALHLVQSDDSISLVLMDMQMPVMSGVDATRAIRKAGYTLPVVALTAGAMDADRNHCIEAGCSEFLSKPINKRKLLDLLEKLAEHREASK